MLLHLWLSSADLGANLQVVPFAFATARLRGWWGAGIHDRPYLAKEGNGDVVQILRHDQIRLSGSSEAWGTGLLGKTCDICTARPCPAEARK